MRRPLAVLVVITVGCGGSVVGPDLNAPRPPIIVTAAFEVDPDGSLCSGTSTISPGPDGVYHLTADQYVCLHLVAQVQNPDHGCGLSGAVSATPKAGMLNTGLNDDTATTPPGYVSAHQSKVDVVESGFGIYRGHGAPGTYTVTGTIDACLNQKPTATIQIVVAR